ncbi:MAG TPA: RNase adapter RapZ, partial [Usitatibacter sp.]|nr:RNase adapter RapZ [Usitatibacter sp.]
LDQRATLTVAIGCTGGRHRSVFVAEQLGARFASEHEVVVRHRDLKP